MTQVIAESLSHQQGGHMRSAVERIAAFAAAARPEHLTNDIRRLFKRNILDSLGCAIAALQGQPCQALREQFEEYRAPGRCTLIGGGRTSADQAAPFHSGLVRYVDLLDSYMAPGGLCHPGDNFGTVLAAAERAGASGEEFMLALAVAYEIQCRFSAAVPVMANGFNHATQLAIFAAASAGKLLGLSAGILPRHSVSFQGHRDDTYSLWFVEHSAFLGRRHGFARTRSVNIARFRPFSKTPHKSVSDMQFNQIIGGAQSQQSGININ